MVYYGILKNEGLGRTMIVDSNNLRIGDSGNVHVYFVGSIDDVRIYSSSLTVAQVQKLYSEESSRIKLVKY
ncbi:MAG: hypothetical protein EOM85_01425 [Candidatus Moranbacteria bacterium]|nr:hypothetical protein [Candidatus Moranbacteria bacterium]